MIRVSTTAACSTQEPPLNRIHLLALCAALAACTHQTSDDDDDRRRSRQSSSGGAAGNTLLFSEYIEGAGNDRAIVIVNRTGLPEDLGGYSLTLIADGDTPSEAPLDGFLDD